MTPGTSNRLITCCECPRKSNPQVGESVSLPKLITRKCWVFWDWTQLSQRHVVWLQVDENILDVFLRNLFPKLSQRHHISAKVSWASNPPSTSWEHVASPLLPLEADTVADSGWVRTSQGTRKEGTVDWVEVVLSGCVVRHVFTTSGSVRNIKYLTETQHSLSPELTLTLTCKGSPPSQTEPCAALIHHSQCLHTRKTSRLDAGTVFPGCLRQGLLTETGLHLVPLGEPMLLANSPKTSSPLILKLWKHLSYLS